jgi:hypothetical protein
MRPRGAKRHSCCELVCILFYFLYSFIFYSILFYAMCVLGAADRE